MTISDDEKWLEKLSGRSDDTAPEEEDVQAKTLRSVMKQQYQSEMDAMGKPDATQLERLLERCRNERLLEPEQQTRKWWQAYWLPELASVAAICLLVIVGVNVIGEQKGTVPNETVYRGGSDFAIALEKRVAYPAKSAAKLQSEFEAAGASVMIYQVDDVWRVTIDLDLPYSDAIQKLLNQYEIPAIEDKQLRLEYKKDVGQS
ncbi:hypothetical protein [Mariprofundus sp. KV]|uniref:hypothetical protein n=1 Tax=Mariprofundus sp. KV TaxID=2608715 RepID=UPI0015A3864F|nr:hypothetical protein [Mariprofundus sp. KV]NWF35140.1 hypothetical protein [Mariprofundus sp. KV]